VLGIIGSIFGYSWFMMVFTFAELPLWTIHLAPPFHLMGGGAFVIEAEALAMIAEAVPSESRYVTRISASILLILHSTDT